MRSVHAAVWEKGTRDLKGCAATALTLPGVGDADTVEGIMIRAELADI